MNLKQLRPIRLELALALSETTHPDAKITLDGLIQTDPTVGMLLNQILNIKKKDERKEKTSSSFSEQQLYNKSVFQPNCTHPKVTQQSTQTKIYDILNGIEVTRDTCPVCYKVLSERVRIL